LHAGHRIRWSRRLGHLWQIIELVHKPAVDGVLQPPQTLSRYKPFELVCRCGLRAKRDQLQVIVLGVITLEFAAGENRRDVVEEHRGLAHRKHTRLRPRREPHVSAVADREDVRIR